MLYFIETIIDNSLNIAQDFHPKINKIKIYFLFFRSLEGTQKSALINGLSNIYRFNCRNPVEYQFQFEHNTLKDKELPIFITELTWTDMSPWLFQYITSSNFLPDVILGADCFYDDSLFDDVLHIVYILLKSKKKFDSTSNPVFLCTYQNRSKSWSINNKITKFSLQWKLIPLERFGACAESFTLANTSTVNDIQMLVLTL